MALAPCKECGREVSSDATTCPQCGARQRASVWPKVLGGFALLVGAFFAYGFYLQSLPGADEATRARDAYKVCVRLAHEQDGSTQPCERILGDFEAKYGRHP